MSTDLQYELTLYLPVVISSKRVCMFKSVPFAYRKTFVNVCFISLRLIDEVTSLAVAAIESGFFHPRRFTGFDTLRYFEGS